VRKKPRTIIANKANATPKTDLKRSNHETEVASGKEIANNALKKCFKSGPNKPSLHAPK
jgi:hypothetical protein